MNQSVKETGKIVVLCILIVFLAVFFIKTKGNDKFEPNFVVDIEKEEFDYTLMESSYNAEYKNTKSNGMYLMTGKSANDMYYFYLVEWNGALKVYHLKLDNAVMENNTISFAYNQGKYTATFGNNSVVIEGDMMNGVYGDERVDGNYTFRKKLNRFTPSEFEIFKT